MKELKAMRELAGVTQFALAIKSSVSRMRLSLAECNELELSPDETEALRRVLLPAIRERRERSKQFENALENAQASHD